MQTPLALEKQCSVIDRPRLRRRLPNIVAGLIATIGIGLFAHSQDVPPAGLRVQLLDPRNSLYALYGLGGNALMLERDNDVLLVDAKSTAAGDAMWQAARAVADKPIHTIIFTHAHADHTGGWHSLKDLTRILIHERAAASLDSRILSTNGRAPSIERVQDHLTLGAGGQQIELHYFGRGHTDGDLVVVFPESRLAHLGDLFPAKAAPSIDLEHGGSGLILPETLARTVAALKARGVRRISTGHDVGAVPPKSLLGDLMTIEDLEEYAAFTADLRDLVRTGFKSGKSVEAIAVESALVGRYKTYDLTNAAASVATIYRELQVNSMQ